MKYMRHMFFLMIGSVAIHLAAQEHGKHDGGEYCYRIAGLDSKRMVPSDAEMKQYFESLSLQDQEVFLKSDMGAPSEEYANIAYTQSLVIDTDFVSLRQQFPILQKTVQGYPLIYFDSASTAQMPRYVCDKIVEYYQEYKSNVGRGLYDFAEQATEIFEATRAKVAGFIGAQMNEVVFTSGATGGINQVVHCWAEHSIDQGDEIIISEVEHNANFIPWHQLALRKGAVLKRVSLNDQGTVDLECLQACMSEKTKLVAITHQSNILGTSNDIAAIVAIAHAAGAKVLVDAAQSIAHQRINVAQLGCDFLVFSGHKLYGPTGVGVLYINKNVGDECVLYNFGGGSVLGVTVDEIEFKGIPYGMEPGTQPIAQVIGLGAAIDFVVQNLNLQQVQEYETALVRKLAYALQEIPDIALLSPIPAQGQHNNMVTFTTEKYHAYDVAEFLCKYGIAVRGGYHCCQPYHDKIGGCTSTRISLSFYNTEAEVDFFIECIKKLFV